MPNRFHNLRLLSFYSKNPICYSSANIICLAHVSLQEWSSRFPDFFSYSYSFLTRCFIDTVTTKSIKLRFLINIRLWVYLHVVIPKKLFFFHLSSTSISYYTLDRLICLKFVLRNV